MPTAVSSAKERKELTRFVAEDVADLAQLFGERAGLGLGGGVRRLVVHVDVHVDEEGLHHLDHLDGHVEGDGDHAAEEEEEGGHVEEGGQGGAAGPKEVRGVEVVGHVDAHADGPDEHDSHDHDEDDEDGPVEQLVQLGAFGARLDVVLHQLGLFAGEDDQPQNVLGRHQLAPSVANVSVVKRCLLPCLALEQHTPSHTITHHHTPLHSITHTNTPSHSHKIAKGRTVQHQGAGVGIQVFVGSLAQHVASHAGQLHGTGIAVERTRSLSRLGVGLAVQIHGVDKGHAVGLAAVDQQQIGREVLTHLHPHDVSHAEVLPGQRLVPLLSCQHAGVRVVYLQDEG